jgi:NhaP-type Na+/H+ or K+/H+ antiporter
MKEKIWEVIKELLRYIVCALPGIIITWVSGQAWNPEVITISTMVLRAIDKILFDWNKDSKTVLSKGLTQF